MVDCYPELSQEDCPEGTILKEGLAFGGCCPACVTYMGEGEIIMQAYVYRVAQNIGKQVLGD